MIGTAATTQKCGKSSFGLAPKTAAGPGPGPGQRGKAKAAGKGGWA